MTEIRSCPACGDPRTELVHRTGPVPTNSMLLLDDADEARKFSTGVVALAVCHHCGFAFNAEFDPAAAEYSARYEASQAYSGTFNAFARWVARRWADRYVPSDATIVEIGADKGDFLALLCELTGARGVGIDPASDPERQAGSPVADRLRFLPETYGPQHADLRPDVVVCRHTLEHLADVAGFLDTLRESLAERLDVPVLFEIPDTERVLDRLAFWDVYYEHCSYFTPHSVQWLFERSGFEVCSVERVYGDQYLLVEALPVPSPVVTDPDRVAVVATVAAAQRYGREVPALAQRWSEALAAATGSGTRTVVWGGGSKAVAFLTALDDPSVVDTVVDINPHKQGRLLPLTAHCVSAPEELGPGDLTVVAMNPMYRDEIAAQLRALGHDAKVRSVEDDPANLGAASRSS